MIEPFAPANPSGIAERRKPGSTKSREVIYGGRGAKIRADDARQRANAREADRAAAELWSVQMEAYGGPAQPSPTIAQ